jgi:hypothetical protein
MMLDAATPRPPQGHACAAKCGMLITYLAHRKIHLSGQQHVARTQRMDRAVFEAADRRVNASTAPVLALVARRGERQP